MKIREIIKLMLTITFISLVSCKKQNDWLDKKTSLSDVAPETLADFQAMLDNTNEMNKNSFLQTGILASDNVYIPDEELPAIGEREENVYLWKDDVLYNGTADDWNSCYRSIEFANLTLDGLKGISENGLQYNNIKGQAYFFRAAAMFNLAQVYCKPYVEKNATTDLGIPIRETSDVNVIIKKRSSVKETYDKILSDLQLALSLLPSNQPYIQRPTSITAKAFLAKVYLTMENYQEAGRYANDALLGNNKLLDFNSNIVSTASVYPFPFNGVGNPEILLFARTTQYVGAAPEAFGSSVGVIPQDLYNLYDNNDLRKTTFYTLRNKVARLVGTYTGTFYDFSGLGTNEIYLIRAETAARNGDAIAAMQDINKLLTNRYKTGTYIDQIENNPEAALRIVLNERRKELAYTGNIRWEDLRRLNLDPRFQKALTRTSNGKVYTLLPNDKKYIFPIPENEIAISGIEPNDR